METLFLFFSSVVSAGVPKASNWLWALMVEH